MCKAGGIYGLKYDVQTGLAGAALAGSLSLAIGLANGDWQDGKLKDTAKSAAGQTVMNGGVALGTHVATAQLSRAGATKAMRPVADAVIKKCLSPKVTGKLASTVSGKALDGAATSSYLSKVTRGNALSIGVVSAVEAGRTAVQLANGKLKGQQAARHTVKLAAGLTAGSIGWSIGASFGAAIGSIVPGPGNLVGGFVGGLIGSCASTWATDAMLTTATG